MQKEKLFNLLKNYFTIDDWYFNHALKVLTFAEQIYKAEQVYKADHTIYQDEKEGDETFIYEVIVLTSIFHDIGSFEVEKKYKSVQPQFIMSEAPIIARKIMKQMSIRPDILERVCYILSNYYTRSEIDGLDFQIIWEADLLVDIQEGTLTIKEGSVQELGENFKTNTGIRLLENWYTYKKF